MNQIVSQLSNSWVQPFEILYDYCVAGIGYILKENRKIGQIFAP